MQLTVADCLCVISIFEPYDGYSIECLSLHIAGRTVGPGGSGSPSDIDWAGQRVLRSDTDSQEKEQDF